MGGIPLPWIVKLVIAVIIDAVDFVIGAIPGVGDILDLAMTGVAVLLFGAKGVIYFWEVIALVPLNAVDMFIPTMTLLAIWDRRSS